MAKRIFLAVLVVAVLAAAAFWWLTAPVTISAAQLPPRAPVPENGRTVFNIGGCASCHATPDQPDRLKLGGGLAILSPFGTFHVPNISPDPVDGIGRWSEADFVSAVLKGTSPAGTHYYPAFPYGSYQHARLDDVRDLFSYMKTLPPVSGRAPGHDLPFPFNIRRTVGIWKLLFLDGKTFTPDPARSPQWNRGAYLVNSFGHCAECHSPRNRLGGIVAAQRFAGGPNPEGKGWVPNITQKGLSDWSEIDLAYFLQTGMTLEGDTVGGSMARVISNTSQLSVEDRAAMATYLKSLPAVDGPPRPPRTKAERP
ncbi:MULTISPECIES: cytochrome c [Rhodopseudomonas]|uniref:Alkylated DNA repair protein n=1 Tax=Rhodopseudomonas palustris TaxID=1076 RepID=A0A0D7E7N1_RHOPL|nr:MULTISPECIES: cytochrome c [Rhodopseudomonas]KIZ36606.1 alkylated DNA repair protein [Rhodopseudomonas palustris]MDF3812789.1 cytochrome c [Rhodopseudomonas sp. BAL398]WOK20326.1 cytochrome c [Rhodopseudomonas sp. BAL398]